MFEEFLLGEVRQTKNFMWYIYKYTYTYKKIEKPYDAKMFSADIYDDRP